MPDPRPPIDANAVPSPRRETDVAALPLSAREGYVLSRMDGVMTVGDLLSACGVPQDEGERILDKLVDLGAVDILELVVEREPAKAGGSDVTPALQERIAAMLRLSEEGNFYELLGVAPDSDKTVLRSAYFDLSKEFHPDSYYGKDLGPWRGKMETVFGRLTDAYETLSRPKKRSRYDEYIADQIRAWEMEKRLAQVPALVLYRPRTQPEEEPAAEPTEAAGPARGAAPAAPAAASRPAAVLGQESEVHRRLRADKKKRALQALLKATGQSPGAPRRAEEPAARPFVAATAEQKLSLQYAIAGADALDRKEFMAALNYFELALKITPDDPQVHDAVERVREEAGAALSTTYEKQGIYEEELGQHVRAAQSFMKALDVRPRDHALMARTALNLLKGGGNLKRAEDLARNAVKLAPDTVDYRATLVEILLKRGAAADAGRELEEARRRDPGNARVQQLLSRGGR